MRRLLLVLCGLLLYIHVFAQNGYGYDDEDDEYNYGYDPGEYGYDPNPGNGATNGKSGNGTTNGKSGNGAGTVNIYSGYDEQSQQKVTLPNSQPLYFNFYNTVQNPEYQASSPGPVRDPEPVIEYRYIPLPAPEPPPRQSPPPSQPMLPPQPQIEYRYIPVPVPEPIYIQPPPLPPPPPPEPPPPQIEYRYLPSPPIELIYIQPPAQETVYIQPPPVRETVYIKPPVQEPVYTHPPRGREPVYTPPPRGREPVYTPPPRAREPVYTPPPPTGINVMPGLPNPKSHKVYRIQIGSYAVHNTADVMARRIRAAGLQACTEYYSSYKRVYVPGVRARDVCSIVQILESLGFQEVWIRE